MATFLRTQVRIYLTLLFLLGLATPVFAVWPIPSYTEYPCTGTVSPPENCSSQGGDPLRHYQRKVSDDTHSCTPTSGQFGGFCDGPGCFSNAGWCRQPEVVSATGTAGFVNHQSTVKFRIEYKFPNNYCQLSPSGQVAEWPIVFNDYHLTRLYLRNSNGAVIATTMAVFEHGTWEPVLPVCGLPATFQIEALNGCGLNQVVDFTVSPGTSTPKECVTAKECPTCGMSGSPAPPGGPALPMNIGSGDVAAAVPLFTIAQPPLPLSMVLTYHSELPGNAQLISEPMGRGWTHPYNQRLAAVDPAGLYLYRFTADGDEHYFQRTSQTTWAASSPGELRDTVTLTNGRYEVKDLNGMVTRFDPASGAWLSTSDRWGNTISGSYAGSLLTAVTDTIGRQVQFAYSGGALSQITLPDGTAWRLVYDANGELARIFDPLHASATPWRSFEYAADTRGTVRLMTAMRDDAGKLLEGHAYDAAERGISSFTEGGRDLVTMQYNGSTPTQTIVTQTLANGLTRTATFSMIYQRGRYLPLQVSGNCFTCTSGGADNETLAFDGANHVLSRTDGSGHTTRFSYDVNGNVLTKTQAFGTPNARTFTYSYGYPAWPKFITQMTETSAARPGAAKVTSAVLTNNETIMTTAQSGWLQAADAAPTTYTRVDTFDARHRPLSSDGPRDDVADVVAYAYYSDSDADVNRRGRLQSATDAVGLARGFDQYDVYGTARLMTDSNGVQTLLQTDGRGRAVSTTNKSVAGDVRETSDYTTATVYDSRDRMVRQTLPRGNAVAFVYEDGSNRIVDTIRLDGAGNEVERQHLTLNAIGDKIREEDQQCAVPAAPCTGWLTRRQDNFVYDDHDRLVQIVHAVPAGASVRYGYDPNGLLLTIQDENHTAPNTRFIYDELDRLVRTERSTAAGTVTTRYAYDIQDNVTAVTDPNGNTTAFSYDDFHRNRATNSPVSGGSTFVYNPAGLPTSMTDGNGATTTRTFDAAGRLLTATSTNGGVTETITYAYDDPTAGNYGKGRLKSVTDPSGSMTYAYERRGMVRGEQHTIQGNSYTIGYGYDANGNRSSMTYPSGRVVSYAYDFADRPQSASSNGMSYVSNAAYAPFGPETQLAFGNGTTKTTTYDLRYRPIENKLTGGAGVIADYGYSEDAVGNITAIRDLVDPSYNRAFGYDDLHRLTSATTGGALWGSGSYAYDAMGNMTALALGSARTSSFAYSGTLPKLSNVTENGSARAVAYDAAGNELTVGANAYAYSPRNYLASGDGLAYTYDARGVRTITTVAAALGTFSGNVVTAATGAPVAGAVVTVDGTLNSTTTDASGNFSLNQPAGNYTLTVVKLGFLPETTTAFTLASGASVAVGTVKLSVAPSTITGTVVSSLGGNVAGATVALSGTTATTSTDALGRFSITQPAGTYTATITAGGYEAQTTPSFTTQSGQTYPLGTITLAAIPATVTGTVTSSIGGAVAGATVTAIGGPTGASHRFATQSTNSTTTDGSGNFTLSLAAGTYSFTIAKSGFGTTTTADVTLGAGTTFSTGTIVIDPLGTITGTVVSQVTGSPVVNATVTVSGSVNSASTDANGRFSLQQPPGSYSIHVSAAGFADTSTAFFTLAPGATYDAGTIQLPAIALGVYVGYADDLRPSANFPVPWAGSPNVVYIGTPSPIDAGAIRLDNNTDSPMPVDNVTVDLGRPGPSYNLWGSFTVPAHGSVILTQTQPFNFDTSDEPIVGCGGTLVAGDPRVPRVIVTTGGVATTYFDTGHILDTGGFDLACRGNESLQWRLIGTTGINANGDFLLGPPTGTSPLGQPYTVTASVTDGTGQPLANVTVHFTVIAGPNRTRTGTATTDTSGHASFTYTSNIAGTDTIQATITNASGGSSTSNPVTVNWPAFTNINVFVGYADDLRPGAAFPNPWQGSPNVVFIGNRGGDWDSGAVRIDNSSDAPVVIDRVVVDLQRPGPTFSLWGSFTIPAHFSAILAQTGPGENFDTSDFPIVGCGGTIAPNDPRIPKITITTAGQSASYLDTSHILDTFGYDLVCQRNESLQWRPVGSSSTTDAGHLALQPLATITPIGGNYTATAIATDAGNEPVAGLRIDFRVVTGPNSGRTGSATTNSSGIATFTYSSTLTGTDVVRASITNSVGAVLTSNDVSSTWVSTVRLTLTPDTATTTVGTPYNATVLVTDGGNAPLANVFVTFRISSGPNSGKTGQGITDATGHAIFTYFSTVQGTDTVVASVVGSGGNAILSNNVSSIWVAPVAITLAPSTATTPIGSSYTATAFVSTGGSPSAGAPVTFNVVAGPNAGRTQSGATDGTGHATFTYTSAAIGTDVIEAKTGSLTSNQIVAKWVAVPTLLVYTGDVAGEYNDPMTLSARLTEATTGAPIAGKTLSFNFGGTTYSATTDSSGTARVTVTPTMTPGAVPLSISFAAAGSYTGSSLSLFVNVVRDESAIRYTGKTVVANGMTQTLTALLNDPDGGEPLAGRLVAFTIGSLTATATTDASGIASATVTVPASLGTGPIRLTASFGGDAYNVPASTSVPVILYQPQSFVIWGGNAVPPKSGDRVNFWGDQWDKQVTAGDYDFKANFKGWGVPAGSPIALCEATVKATGACWSSKPGQSFPPASIERYISVIVSTSIGQGSGNVVGNIAATVVVRVDPVPAYSNDPGKSGYGVIVGVIDDGAHLFPASLARPVASADAAPFFFRHVTKPRPPQVVSLVQPDLANLAVTNEWMSIARTSVLAPAPFTVAAGSRRYSFYSPELSLIAETALATNGTPAIAYEYIWFNGHPVAQVDAGGATHWTFTDHLGTPLVLTNSDGSTYWRAEYEPFGAVYALRSADVHQPLRLPGQEAEQLNLGANGVTEREYNVHRWYRGGWGRYSQVDPLMPSGNNEYAYADDGPINGMDPDGLMTFTWLWGPDKPKPTPNPSAMCKYAPTKVACTNFKKAKLACTCLCVAPTQWAPQIVLFVQADMYIYNGHITPSMVVDKSIVDFATAVAHETDKHLKPAAQAIENYFRSWVPATLPSQADCDKTCKQVKGMEKMVTNMYKEELKKTAVNN
jgi:RHS repeat-associated protein